MAMNNVALVGRLTKDLELKRTPDGIATTSFTLAVDRTMSKADRDAAAAAGRPTTDFINCVAWRKTAEILAQYAMKGTQLAIDGRIQTRNYTNQTGQKVYVTEVVVNNAQLLGGTRSAQPQGTAQYAAPTPAPTPTPAPAPVEQVEPEVVMDISSDDLPFY